MKLLLLALAILSLTGCGLLESKQDHTKVMLETVKFICGSGDVSIESNLRVGGDDSNSSFKVECSVEGE